MQPDAAATSDHAGSYVAQIVDALPALVAYIDKSLYTRFLNRAFADWFGRPIEELENRPIADILGSEDFSCARPYMESALSGMPQRYERSLQLSPSRICHVIASYVPHIDKSSGEVLGFFSLLNDVTELKEGRDELTKHRLQLEQMVNERTRELLLSNSLLQQEIASRQRAQMLADGEKQTMEMICSGVSLQKVLEALCNNFEKFSHGGLCSILIVDEEKQMLLRDVSPGLPEAFVTAVKEVPIAADAGCSGTAAYFRTQVVAEDIASDCKWMRYRDIALANNIRSSWSMPIFSAIGKVLGTFALYYDTPQRPPETDRELVERAAHLAAIAFERDLVEERLNYLASHDPLTHLPNRHLIQGTLSKAIARAQREQSICALLFIDLDQFKEVNDQLGHDSGDELLRQVAKRLVGTVRQEDTIGRLGGDEFTAILENIDQPKDAEEIAAKLTHAMSRRFQIGDKEVFISCSIGIALYPQQALESQTLLKKADAAMYYAKNHGRNNYKMYVPQMDSGAASPLNLQSDLLAAIEFGQFVLYYQPTYDSATQTMTSMEALIRWNHPKMGLLMPPEFLPFAEESGLIVKIGKWVIQQVCVQNKQWHDAGHQTRVAINMSAGQVRQPDFASYVQRTLEQAGLPAQYLELELAESIVTQYDQRSFDNLAQLKRFGVYITVDDFGTGYSSLSYLKRLPIDGLKIDQSFMQDAATNEEAASIVNALLALAKSLNLSVTAQGVERDDQRVFLVNHGCQHLQGFAISEPLTADHASQMLERSRTTPPGPG